MKALRAWHLSANEYLKVVQRLTGIPINRINEKYGEKGNTDAFDWTNRLTTIRKNLARDGYEKEVEEADRLYLKNHRGFASEEKWENFWAKYLKNHKVPPYPRDAI